MEIGTSRSVNVLGAKFFKSKSLSQFEAFLVDHGIPVELFGINNAKTSKELLEEVTGEVCTLETGMGAESFSRARLQRRVAAVLIELRANIHGEDMFLVLKDVMLDSGVKRVNVNTRMALAIGAAEDITSAMRRCFQDNLQVDEQAFKAHFVIESIQKTEETRESLSYPGLPCVYNLQIAQVRVLHPSTPVLSRLGLPSGAEFQTKRVGTSRSTLRTWIWCSRTVFNSALEKIDGTKVADVVMDSSPVEPGAAKALAEEIRTSAWMGLFASAYRALQRLEASGENPVGFVDDGIIERVNRIAPLYAETVTAFDRTEQTICKMSGYAWYDDLQAEIAYSINTKDSSFTCSSIADVDIDAGDIVTLIAGFSEVDLIAVFPQDYSLPASAPRRSSRRRSSLSGVPAALAGERAAGERQDAEPSASLPRAGGGFSKHIQCAVEIGRAFTSDAVWHLFSREPDLKVASDDVMHSSIVDALDEPCGSLYTMLYTVLNTDGLGRQLPPAVKWRLRQPFMRLRVKVKPQPGGAKLCVMVDVSMHPALCRILSLCPTWIMKKVLKNGFTSVTKDYDTYVKTFAPLRERMKVSARAPLYERMRKRAIEATAKVNANCESNPKADSALTSSMTIGAHRL